MRIKRILVTGAGGAAAANFIRSLKLVKNGYYVVGVDSNEYHLALSPADKKYVADAVSPKKYISYINDVVKKEKIDLVHSQPDGEIKFLSDNRTKIKAKTFLPDISTINICQNKWSTYKALKKSKISVPETMEIRSRIDLQKAFKNLSKTKKIFWIRAKKGAGSKASLPADNVDLAYYWMKYWWRRDPSIEFVASEFLPGSEFAFQSLWHNGKLIVSQARQRLEYLFGYLTPSGQTSSPALAKTVTNELVNYMATGAVLSVSKNATGVFCVDLKNNEKGMPVVTEINSGRFFTTSEFFSKAGCNMPHYYCSIGTGTDIKGLKQYNFLKEDLYWARMIDMGSKLIYKKPKTKKIIVFSLSSEILASNEFSFLLGNLKKLNIKSVIYMGKNEQIKKLDPEITLAIGSSLENLVPFNHLNIKGVLLESTNEKKYGDRLKSINEVVEYLNF